MKGLLYKRHVAYIALLKQCNEQARMTARKSYLILTEFLTDQSKKK